MTHSFTYTFDDLPLIVQVASLAYAVFSTLPPRKKAVQR